MLDWWPHVTWCLPVGKSPDPSPKNSGLNAGLAPADGSCIRLSVSLQQRKQAVQKNYTAVHIVTYCVRRCCEGTNNTAQKLETTRENPAGRGE